MSRIKWTETMDATLRRSVGEGATAAEAAVAVSVAHGGLTVTGDMVSSRMRRLGLKSQAAEAQMPEPPAPPAEGLTYFEELMVRKPARKSSLEAAWAALPTEATGLVLSDTHGILTDWDALERALSRESYDFILHAGDFIDFAVDSKYMPYSHTSFEAELEGGARTLLRLEDTGVPVFAVKGNHDDRPTKLAASRVPSYLLPWFRDPLNELVSRIPTLYMPDRPIHEQWYVQLGDILLTHAEAMPGTQSAAGKALSVATMRRHDLGLPGDPIRLVLAGHPHKFRMEQRGQDTTLVDLDMLCTTPQYARVASAMKYQTPTSRGWLTIAVDGDRVDLSDIRHTVDED